MTDWNKFLQELEKSTSDLFAELNIEKIGSSGIGMQQEAGQSTQALYLKDSKSWKNLLIESGLSVRAFNILKKNFADIEEFISFDPNYFSVLPNCGAKTIAEINGFLVKIKNLMTHSSSSNDANNIPHIAKSKTLKEKLSEPPAQDTIRLLPVFYPKSSEELEEIVPMDLHPDFKANVLLENIAFSIRTTKILKQMGLKTTGDLMCTPMRTLLKQKNFGRYSLKEVQKIIMKLVFGNLMKPLDLIKNINRIDEDTTIDYSSYNTMVMGFIKAVIASPRDQQILFNRFCFNAGKIPTLEELGKNHHITRERIRQILRKSYKLLKIKSNFNRLLFFWETVSKIIKDGGGVVHLEALSLALKEAFHWPEKPNPPALGHFLSLLLPDKKLKNATDIIQIKTICKACSKPANFIKNLDFESTDVYHIGVVGKKLFDDCSVNCEVRPLPVAMFHDAFIEKAISSTSGQFVVKDHMIYPYDKWVLSYGNRLEDVASQILKDHGEPMHYSEIAREVRKTSAMFEDMPDRNIHASISRYPNIMLIDRGTFALKEWGLPQYQSVSDAIEKLLIQMSFPVRKDYIFSQLQNEFSSGNISSALQERTNRFVAIGNGFYDIRERWLNCTCESYVTLLPKPLQAFLRYLISNNNCSYKCVAALIFISNMRSNGSLAFTELREKFYDFYASRHAKGLLVEREDVIASQIHLMDPWEFQRKALIEPLKSFLHSGYFFKLGQGLLLERDLAALFKNNIIKDIMTISLLKSIDQYFQALEPSIAVYCTEDSSARASIIRDGKGPDFGDDGVDSTTASEITIKKIKRMKIKL